MPLNYLVNLNKLGRGIDKQWIYRDPLCKELAHDYLQKINFSIQDINSLLGTLGRIEKRTDVISLIVLVDWIVDSVWQYKSCILKEIMDTFTFSRQNDLEKNLAFLKAIRSFIVAHPLNTTKHNALGFSGDRVCIDLRVSRPFAFANINKVQRIGVNGIEPYDNNRSDDVYLYIYSKRNNAELFEFLVLNLADILNIARIYIDQLSEIDKYLSKLRKNTYTAK